MNKWIEDVKEFQAKLPPEVINTLGERITMMKEEISELEKATSGADRLDALVDLLYSAIGTATMFGWKLEEAWDIVHVANMQKTFGATKRGFKVDMSKPKGWEAPNLKGLFDDR